MSLADIASSLVRNRAFVIAISGRDLKGLHRGSILGIAWIFIRPFIQVIGFTVIVYLLGARTGTGGPFDYALHVLAGLAAWQALQRSLEDAPNLIRDRMEVLRQIVYPIETIPMSAILVALVAPSVSVVAYAVIALASGRLPWSIALLPLPVALLVILLVGASWLLMVAGVVIRDLREMISVLMSLLVYLSPVVLTREMVGERFWQILLLNPLAHVVLCFRDVLQGTFHPWSWVLFTLTALILFLLGGLVLARVKMLVYELL